MYHVLNETVNVYVSTLGLLTMINVLSTSKYTCILSKSLTIIKYMNNVIPRYKHHLTLK